MSLDALIGKPSPIPPVATFVPDEEPALEDDESLVQPMSLRELQRMMEMIRVKAQRLRDVDHQHGRVVTDRDMLTGV